MRSLQILLATFLLLSVVHSWEWNSYTGSSSWQVTVTEDESGCGGGVYSDDMTMPIVHNGNSATVTDLHGTIGGTFSSGNVLHIPGRRVTDAGGYSVLSAYDIFFTTDCTSFAARYTWDYRDAYQSCSGSTRMAGTNAAGCPKLPGSCQSSLDCNTTSSCVNGQCVPTPTQGVCTSDSDCNAGHICSNGVCVTAPPSPPPPSPTQSQIDIQLRNARNALNNDMIARRELDDLHREHMRSLGYHPPNTAEGDYYEMVRKTFPALMSPKQDAINTVETDLESKYFEILKKDPDNFWANWDMAILRKSQGNGVVAGGYLDTALEHLQESTKQQLKSNIQSSMNIENPPSSATSKVVQSLGSESKQITSVSGIDMTKLTQKQRDRVAMGLITIILFDRNGDVTSALNIQTD